MKELFHVMFEHDFKCYYRDIYNFVYHYVMNGEEAEDLVQDVFLKFLDNYGNIPKDMNRRQYLFVIARNLCMSYFRRRSVLDHNKLKIFESLDYTSSSEYDTTYDELARVLDLSFEHLTLEQRQIIRLKLQGRDYNEISAELGISSSKVHKNIKKAYAVIKFFAGRMICFFC